MNILILELIGLLCMCKIIIIIYFDSFGVEHIPEEIRAFIYNNNDINNKNAITNIFRI